MYLPGTSRSRSMLIDCSPGQFDVSKVVQWRRVRIAMALGEDRRAELDMPFFDVSDALTALHNASAFEGSMHELVTGAASPLLPALRRLTDCGLASLHIRHTGEAWKLTELGTRESHALQVVATGTYKDSLALHVRPDVGWEERSTWELMQILATAGWQYRVWEPRKKDGAWVYPAPYRVGDTSAENLTWFTLKSARSVSWNYISALARAFHGDLMPGRPIPHFEYSVYYAAMLAGKDPIEASARKKKKGADIDMEAACSAGICDLDTSSLAGQKKRRRQTKARSTKVTIGAKGEDSDFEEPADLLEMEDDPRLGGTGTSSGTCAEKPPAPAMTGESIGVMVDGVMVGGSSSSSGGSGSAAGVAAAAAVGDAGSAAGVGEGDDLGDAPPRPAKAKHPKSFHFGQVWFIFRPSSKKTKAERFQVGCPCASHIDIKKRKDGSSYETKCTKTLGFLNKAEEDAVVRRLKLWVLEAGSIKTKRRHQQTAPSLKMELAALPTTAELTARESKLPKLPKALAKAPAAPAPGPVPKKARTKSSSSSRSSSSASSSSTSS